MTARVGRADHAWRAGTLEDQLRPAERPELRETGLNIGAACAVGVAPLGLVEEFLLSVAERDNVIECGRMIHVHSFRG